MLKLIINRNKEKRNIMGIVFDINKLQKYCQVKPDYFLNGKDYKFINNNGDVLAVAHVDTVYQDNNFYRNGDIITSSALDDRLGVYTIIELSKFLKFDILLTTDEEIGMSTAQYFNTKKKYNWIFSFDRKGSGCVLYDYEYDNQWYDTVSKYFKVNTGSFSDICYLKTLGVCGINVGTEYNNEHSYGCYMSIKRWAKQVNDFIYFFIDNCNKKFIFNEKTIQKDWGNFYNPRKTVSNNGKSNTYINDYISWWENEQWIVEKKELAQENKNEEVIDYNNQGYDYCPRCDHLTEMDKLYYSKISGNNICSDCFYEEKEIDQNNL